MYNTTKTIVNKIINRIKFQFEVSRKYKEYKSDINYIANSDISKCFEDRIITSNNDTLLLKRISTAYKKASHDLHSYSKIFHPSNEWLPIYKNNYKEITQALEDGNVDRIDEIYRNFWRESCSLGLVGLPIDMNKTYFKKNEAIKSIHKHFYLNDAIYRFNLWMKLNGNRHSIDQLISPMIGNPYGYFIGDKFIKSGADYQHHYASRINDILFKINDRKIISEIGGGFGGMAYYLIRDSINTTYIDFDLPENLALTSYYLLKAFPEKKILLYDEAEFNAKNIADFDVILMPNFMLNKLPKSTCHMIFNSYSLAEMSAETISHYVAKSTDFIKTGGWLFHVNHTKHSLVSAHDFPIPENFELISEKFAAWNLGRNSNMDEFEFLYQKNKHIYNA
jgi:putative sugar O-methyltransferase